MTDVQNETEPRWRQIGLWVMKALLAVVFLAAGGAKLIGVQVMVEGFAQLGFGQWFRYLTGFLEAVGAIAILIPASAAFGGLLLCCVMVGAVLAHLFFMPGSPLPAVALFILSALVVYAHRDQIAAFRARFS